MSRLSIKEDLQQAWVDWADKQFPQATNLSRVRHLIKEVGELETAIIEGGNIAEEVIDCWGLLTHIFATTGQSANVASGIKLMINMNREWGEVNSDGFVEHVGGEEND